MTAPYLGAVSVVQKRQFCRFALEKKDEGMTHMLARVVLAVASSLMITTAAMAEDLDFTLTNQSSDDVVEFFVSHTGTDAWEENLISGGFLPPGNEINIVIADGHSTCTYDVKATFSNGAALEDYDLDLCELGSYTFYDQ